ncbi:hypothetical protein SK128_027907 [Halocaridina rubra]|uniref:Potassium channel domain-containing protein n=1 Tax=Halocaridina rubra TaxID=373956 RepID=A0AAN8WSV1_HALRR
MMSYKQWLVLLFIYIVFMLVGAVVFLYLEIDNELAERQDILELKRKVIDLVYSLENGSRAEVVEVVQELGDNCGEDFLHIDKNKNLVWSYWNSFFFTFTVITTIGFGHMSPATPWGRIFCIVYATIGVPLNGIVIASLADLFSSKVINSRMRARAKRYESWVGIAADAALFLLPGFVVFLIIPAAILVAAEEDWNYLDSFYYAFITLTTIGFGDLVAGERGQSIFY